MQTLTAWDYVIIAAMLIFSAAIGVYFALLSRSRQTSDSYFLGDRGMSVFPVAMSLTATYISAITYLGTPAEVYVHGPKYGLMIALRSFVPFILMFWVIPVFYRLQITTIYEYLEMRFNNTVRFLVITAQFLGGFTYMGIVVYTPALALSTVTGMNLTFSILAMGVICTFYTSIGGIKAVIWTDVFQAFAMTIGAFVMIIVGNIKIGGPLEGWRRAEVGERTELVDFNINPTVRLTFWSVCIGGTSFLLMIGGTKQSFVQRYLACKSEKTAQTAAWIGMIGTGFMELLAVSTGMTVFAYYYSCDPLTSSEIDRPDQIVPYFIMDVFGSVPGVPGLLISAAFCAALSSMSSVLSAMASTTGQDIVKTIWPDISDRHYSIVVKVISAVFGIFTIALAFLASVLGDVLQTAMSIGGLSGGPVFGIFIIGLFVPRGNSTGAIAGFFSGILVGFFFYIGSQIYPPIIERPPLSTEGCSVFLANETTSAAQDYTQTGMFTNGDHSVAVQSHGPAIFGLSYLYLSFVTGLASVLVGVIVSYITSMNNPRVAHPKLLSPLISRYMDHSLEEETKNRKPLPTKEYIPIEKV